MLSLLTFSPSFAVALPATEVATSAAPLTPTSLRKVRLLGFFMLLLLLRRVGELLAEHGASADDRTGGEADNPGGQGIGPLAAVGRFDRGIAVEGGRFVNLHLVANRRLEEDIRLGAADAG